jgi:predicted RNA-binding protein YlqC (UPF0109 family)
VVFLVVIRTTDDIFVEIVELRMNTRQVTAHWVVEFQDVINDTEFTTVGIVVRKTDIGHVIARGKEGVVVFLDAVKIIQSIFVEYVVSGITTGQEIVHQHVRPGDMELQ